MVTHLQLLTLLVSHDLERPRDGDSETNFELHSRISSGDPPQTALIAHRWCLWAMTGFHLYGALTGPQLWPAGLCSARVT